MHSEHHLSLFHFRKRHSGVWRGSTLFSLFMVVFMLLTACGGPAKSTGSKVGGVLTVSGGGGTLYTDSFNPWLFNQNNSPAGYIYEALFHWNRLDSKITPLLATSQQFTGNGSGITFTIRQGVKWSDGQPFSADDVLFTFNLMHANPGIDTIGIWQELKSVTEPSANTIHIDFVKPSSSALWDIAGVYIIPKHIWQSIKQPGQYTNKNPIGTGPFLVKSFSPEKYVFQRNPNYWQKGLPTVSEIDFPAYTDNTSADLALSQGIVDWGGLFIPDIQNTYIKRDPQHNHYWFSPGNTVMLYVNLTKWPFNQLPVRQALSAAIDRNQLVKTAEDGYDVVANPTGILPSQASTWLAPQYSNMQFGPPDARKADSILTSAGFKKGSDGIYVGSNGQRLSFTMSVIDGWSDFTLATQIMSTNLKAAGIEAKVNVVQYTTFIDNLERGKFDTAIYNKGGGPTPYWYYDYTLSSKLTQPVGQLALNNEERWHNAQGDQFLQSYSLSLDPTVEKQAIYGLEKIMVDNLPLIPLYYGSEAYEYSTKHFTGWPDEQHQYAAAPPWETGSDKEAVLLNLRPA